MLVQLKNKSTTQLATGNLIREGIKYPFKYETLDKARKITRNDPIEGFITFQVNTTIKTNTDLKFVFNDKILLEEMEQPMTVVGISRKVNERQYMFLNSSNEVEYTLDLVW